MNRITILFSVLVFSFVSMNTAFAGDGRCRQMYQKALEGAKKDPQCGKDAINVFSSLEKQLRICKLHRDKIRSCNLAKRSKAAACRGQKRSCKTVCRDKRKACKRSCTKGQKNCVKACPRGRKGKACRRSCNQCVRGCNRYKRSCKKVCRGVSRACLMAARKEAHACRSHARTLAQFKQCQSARSVTAKATGRLFGCGWKHYKGAVMCSVSSILSSLKKK